MTTCGKLTSVNTRNDIIDKCLVPRENKAAFDLTFCEAYSLPKVVYIMFY